MSGIDYSKWKNIEISDDEDDTHPNIDTPSLFRWRHQARVQRMEEFEQEKRNHEKACTENKNKRVLCQKKIEELKEANEPEKVQERQKLLDQLKTLENEEKILEDKSIEMSKKEKLAPWNVDTISHEGYAKTVINKPKPRQEPEQISDEERAHRQTEFDKKYNKELKTLGMLRKLDDTKAYLLEHPELVCEETANFFVIWCIDLEVQEKHDLMEHVAHQTIIMQYLLELAKQLNVDPRSVVSSFFTKMKLADKEYIDAFNDELDGFKNRVRDRARIRVEKAIKEIEEEERQKRLGPGGLDPVEVMEQLPQEMQECFEKKDTELLKTYLLSIDRAEAERLMKLCIDSGLWVPNAADAETQDSRENENYEISKNSSQINDNSSLDVD